MKYDKTIATKSGKASYKAFMGINRRLRTDGGECYDMENMSHREYPCICSEKGYKKTNIAVPDNATINKLIIPKRGTDEFESFAGVAHQDGTPYIFVNGARKNSLNSYTDAVDYNGAIVALPDFLGYTYAMKNSSTNEASIAPKNTLWKMRCENYYPNNTASEYVTSIKLIDCVYNWFMHTFSEWYKVGDYIEVYGFKDGLEPCNTIFPSSSLDYSNTESPASVLIKSLSFSGSSSSGTITMTVELRNSKGEIIPWPWCVESITNAQYAHIKKHVPKVTYGCVAHNRIWCCSETGEEVYASALGNPCEFYEFKGIATDSWSVSVGTPGKFTGIAPWQSRVLVFKEGCIQVIYGTTPKDFGIERTYNVGCIDRNSIADAGGMLIWLSYDGFYAYSGGKPERISDKLNTKYVSAVSFSDGLRYYARCTKENGGTELIVFDTENGLWSKLSDMDIISGDFFKGKLYVCTQDSVYAVKEGEYGDFYFESSDLTFETFHNKSLIYITVRCKINSGFINLYTSVNGGEWIPHKGISKTGKHRLPIRYSSGDILRFRIEGSGDVAITELELDLLVEERS